MKSVPVLLSTVVLQERDRGIGKVAGEVVVSDMIMSGVTTLSTSVGNFHRSPRAPNDGRESRSRSFNIDFGMSTSASLPPSTGNFRSINMEQIDKGVCRHYSVY